MCYLCPIEHVGNPVLWERCLYIRLSRRRYQEPPENAALGPLYSHFVCSSACAATVAPPRSGNVSLLQAALPRLLLRGQRHPVHLLELLLPLARMWVSGLLQRRLLP